MFEILPVLFASFLLVYAILNVLDDRYPEPLVVYALNGCRSVYKRLRGR